MEKRQANFTSGEVNILLDIVETFKDVIECKKTDYIAVIQKNEAWEAIATDFNAQSVALVYRDARALRKKYENLKTSARDSLGVIKRPLPDAEADPLMIKRMKEESVNTKAAKDRANAGITRTEHPVRKKIEFEQILGARLAKEKAKIEVDAIRAEHAERQRKSARELSMLEAEHEQRMRFAREKHEIEMKILRRQLTNLEESET